ncbi:MAG: hypothetical protein GC157_11705 [Frankiales bacterium]|nr:hypothetical protein [Frankiales bacterium]
MHPGPARPWSSAWRDAALGPRGFYTAGGGARPGPAAYFRTSVHVGDSLHRAVARLVHGVDERLGRPARLDLVDVGAADGGLLTGVLAALAPELAARTRAVGVDVRARPAGLDAAVSWVEGEAPAAVPGDLHGLLLAHEWLDDVPLDVVQVDDAGRARLVLVHEDGHEVPGPALDEPAGWSGHGLDAGRTADWLDRYAELEEPGDRAEVGLARDLAWAALVSRVARGTVLAVDYATPSTARDRTLTGVGARGARVAPVPDGSVNLTAHVRFDSLRDAVPGTSLARQADALAALGVDPRLPDPALATSDPAAYADALVRASEASELLDPAGLGAFTWARVDV